MISFFCEESFRRLEVPNVGKHQTSTRLAGQVKVLLCASHLEHLCSRPGGKWSHWWAVSHSLTDLQHTLDVARSGDRKISWSSLFVWNGICTVSRFRISGLELRGFGRNYSAYCSWMMWMLLSGVFFGCCSGSIWSFERRSLLWPQGSDKVHVVLQQKCWWSWQAHRCGHGLLLFPIPMVASVLLGFETVRWHFLVQASL